MLNCDRLNKNKKTFYRPFNCQQIFHWDLNKSARKTSSNQSEREVFAIIAHSKPKHFWILGYCMSLSFLLGWKVYSQRVTSYSFLCMNLASMLKRQPATLLSLSSNYISFVLPTTKQIKPILSAEGAQFTVTLTLGLLLLLLSFDWTWTQWWCACFF